jgi:hypothetical protein
MIDLFEDYENIPNYIQDILDKYSEDFEDGNYEGLFMALKEVRDRGYTFEYYVNGDAYGLRPIGVPLNELEGYEDVFSEFDSKIEKRVAKEYVNTELMERLKKEWKDKNKYAGGGAVDWYDFDKKMALINLNEIHEYAVKLDNIVTEETELEEWVKMKLTRIEQNVADVKKSLEGWEKFEEFGEGGRIFKKQLLHIAKYAKDLIAMIKLGSKLMSWQENKLAVSAEYIDAIYHHLDYKMGNRASDIKFTDGGRVKTIKESDIKVGAKFELLNGEIIEITRLFKENIDQDWCEFIRDGETKENSVNALKNFINNWRAEKKYANGGGVDSIPNNYEGKSPKDIWDSWSKEQRKHFLYDHQSDARDSDEVRGSKGYYYSDDIDKWVEMEWNELPSWMKNLVFEHTDNGQYAIGGGVAEVSLLKQGDRVYFKLKNKNETFDIYDIATRAEIEEGEVDELPIKGGKVNYAIIDIDSKTKKAIHPKDIVVKGITYLDLEDITEDFYVFIKSGDYTSKYVIIPKESILIDWEKTFASWRINIKQRKKEIKEGTFKFYTGYYDSNNRFNYNKNKYANGGGVGAIKTDFNELENTELRNVLISFWNDFFNNHIGNYLSIEKENYVLSNIDNVFVIVRDKDKGNFSDVEKQNIDRFLSPYFDSNKKPLFADFFNNYEIKDNKIIIYIKDMYANGGGVEDGSYERSLVLKAITGDEDFITKFISEGGNESEYIGSLNKDFVYIQRKYIDDLLVEFKIKVEFDSDEDGVRALENEIIEVEGVEIDIKSFTKDEQKKINDFISELKYHLYGDGENKFKNGGGIGTEISKIELENMIGKKLNGWNDDIVYYNGKKYQKCYLRPYYKVC